MPTAFTLPTFVAPGGTVDWHLVGASIYSKTGFKTPRGMSAKSLCCSVFYNTSFLGSFYSRENVVYTPTNGAFTSDGTIKIVLSNQSLGIETYTDSSYYNPDTRETVPTRLSGTLERFDKIYLAFEETIGPGVGDEIEVFLPAFGTNNSYATLFIDVDGKVYSDSTYATLVCGTRAVRSFSDTATLYATNLKKSIHARYDGFGFAEFGRTNPRRFPFVKTLPPKKRPTELYYAEKRDYANHQVDVVDTLFVNSIRVGTITDWNFKPEYRIFYETDVISEFATTTWHVNSANLGQLSKSLTHWSGEFQVSNWTVGLADNNGEIWGSLFGEGLDARGKRFLLQAKTQDRPIEWKTQYVGILTESQFSGGKASLVLQDALSDVSGRGFVYDYECIGSSNNKLSWGIVKRVTGTMVMFDDYGWKETVIKKTDSMTFAQSMISAAPRTAVSAIGGGWVGAGISIGAGIIDYLFQSKRSKVYYEVTDKNLIPDDLVAVGQVLKFHRGSFSGRAKNVRGPLESVESKTIRGGTFVNGIYGTFSFDDTSGINVGDYVYVQKPIVLNGSPEEVITSLLCGTNIDYPYSYPFKSFENTFVGVVPIVHDWNPDDDYIDAYPDDPQHPYRSIGISPAAAAPSRMLAQKRNDFATSFNVELRPYQLMSLRKTIYSSDNSNPYQEIKQLCSELGVSFYIDSDGRFAAKSIRPRGIIDTSTIATYTESRNILDGFSFTKRAYDSYSGIIVLYDYSGESESGNGFNKKFTKLFDRTPSNIKRFATVESYWVYRPDDAEFIAWRHRIEKEDGHEVISVPTTLWGIHNTVSDVINVTHRMGSLTNAKFEITSENKSFNTSRINFEAINIDRLYGKGFTLWGSSNIAGTHASGMSYLGRLAGTAVGTLGTLMGTLTAVPNLLNSNEGMWAVGFGFYSGMDTVSLRDYVLCIGSLSDRNCELMTGHSWGGTLYLYQRGLGNTIPQLRIPGDHVYQIGYWDSVGAGSITIRRVLGDTFSYATTTGINSNIGTCFNFF